MSNFFAFFVTGAGKTYLGAAGLVGLAIYDATTGNYPGGFQAAMAALSVLGIHTAITVPAAPVATK